MKSVEEILKRLPGKNCGLCGHKTCLELAKLISQSPDAIKRCVYMEAERGYPSREASQERREITWKDVLQREYDFILQKFPEDPGPREVILPFNPVNIERLKIKKGDILFGRPASTGCPVTHVGVVMEEPDYFNGVITWCVVGPLMARERGIEIGSYTPIAYEGLVIHTRKKIEVGRRYYFLPNYCMLQSRHSGLVNTIIKTSEGLRVRIESIWIA